MTPDEQAISDSEREKLPWNKKKLNSHDRLGVRGGRLTEMS